jgi:hypothetical protein
MLRMPRLNLLASLCSAILFPSFYYRHLQPLATFRSHCNNSAEQDWYRSDIGGLDSMVFYLFFLNRTCPVFALCLFVISGFVFFIAFFWAAKMAFEWPIGVLLVVIAVVCLLPDAALFMAGSGARGLCSLLSFIAIIIFDREMAKST